jgi:hypothetical protein
MTSRLLMRFSWRRFVVDLKEEDLSLGFFQGEGELTKLGKWLAHAVDRIICVCKPLVERRSVLQFVCA